MNICLMGIQYLKVIFRSMILIVLFEFSFSAAGGEIFNLCLPEVAEMVSENDVVRLIKQILEGVDYLHQNNIVHLDLKVGNVI